MSAPDLVLDLCGLKCPLPALKTAKFLRSMTPDATVRVICTDPLAVIDIPNLLNETGDTLLDRSESEGKLTFLIRKKAA